MALVASLNILGAIIVVSFAAKTTFARSSNCGHSDLTASLENTIIKSPDYPSDYGDNLNCSWTIKVLFSGYIVKVLFNDFLLEEGYPCDDVLTFYDGMNEASSLLGSYCGTIHPEVIYSTAQYLYVKFDTDNMVNYKGFSLSLTAVKKEEAFGICRLSRSNGGDEINRLGGFSGTFFTPDYPVPYPNDARCNWIISVPSGKRVKLKFEDFDFDPVSSSCKKRTNEKDYVQIGSGQVPGKNALALYCGYAAATALDFYSTGRHMWVKFYSISSNRSESSKGFKAHFEAVDLSPSSKEMCFPGNVYNNKLTLSGSFGSLRSPQDHNWYRSGLSCDWLITVPEGKIVKLKFDKLDLKPSSGSQCTADYVEVLDGKPNTGESKGKFCGDGKPEDIRSSDRYMWVRFRTDPQNSDYEGFKATYTAEDKSRSWTVIVTAIVAVVVCFIALALCVVVIIKRTKTPSRALSTTTALASRTTQLGVIQHPPPHPTQQAAANPYPSLPAPPYTLPSEPPPPYPGEETAPPYSPPGQSRLRT